MLSSRISSEVCREVKAYASKDSPVVTGREACVLVLELLLLINNVEPTVRSEAEQAASRWKMRLVAGDGLHRACEISSRGLPLLVIGYGIPKAIKYDDIWDLICRVFQGRSLPPYGSFCGGCGLMRLSEKMAGKDIILEETKFHFTFPYMVMNLLFILLSLFDILVLEALNIIEGRMKGRMKTEGVDVAGIFGIEVLW
ncbi:hypothetical protein K2173_010960 [Erythroxylum novogranatense]|uniref:FRIGIDA-like protein n=1 Tax=Erythroxylum novogranatense TaxID=1862640 RepID=A0AAV8T1E3_9ROSI|nr:hypothetical protein K2173_010960 [Erythroxylum novogranatense]